MVRAAQKGSKTATPPLSSAVSGKIQLLKGLVQKIEKHERSRQHHERQANKHEIAARRARIDAAKIFQELIAAGVPKMKVYELARISPKEGRHLSALAELYDGVSKADLDRRQKDGQLLSVNQTEALVACAKLQATEKERDTLIELVRDREPLGDPTYGPAQIAVVARHRKQDENELRKTLGISEKEIADLQMKAPVRPQYSVQFVEDGLIVTAPSLPLVFAALTADEATAQRSLQFFSAGASKFRISKIDGAKTNGRH